MAATALLRHDLPDGTRHYDWLLDVDPAADRLWAFRLDQRIDQAFPAELRCHRIADHRRDYLTYEGPVRGGLLGSVARVAAGTADILGRTERSLDLHVAFDRGLTFEVTGGCDPASPQAGRNLEVPWFFRLVPGARRGILKKAAGHDLNG